MKLDLEAEKNYDFDFRQKKLHVVSIIKLCYRQNV